MLMLQGLLALGFISLLSACSVQPKVPLFSASGFITDGGVIRLWRLNDQNSQPQVIMSVYSPYRNTDTSVTFYEYRYGNLWQIRRSVLDNYPIDETLRIDKDNKVIFMQRQAKEHSEPLSSDEIVRLRFDAKRMKEVSDALMAGNVHLIQGYWQDGKVTTCSEKQLSIQFEPEDRAWLKEREKNSAGILTIAWLDAPEGKQLLLVANDDFCRWEPTKDKL
ncbi:conserved hypothetical protein; putative exported protein [Xenorhabdus bovienii str. kraussei Quebec]|uniref:DUF1481 domain-containing protein n=1 Tax=Xenorhabdus bovienii str. kraussei Quebec TaxID=1398203 RepID=A0A077P4W0_XENBV|nr:conserved hypothetical protein; putative exported protein [Xenorhabdus bovienii str. feltiae France]CDG91870.1 conserved hypothetical protein; putative exported protein [Xenorhabdus bovienii str. feltiae Florida]CDH19555.1 conserved hypothetical protein; putative exported protein [Xenorhabdus bovienii str. kraussei Quebec]